MARHIWLRDTQDWNITLSTVSSATFTSIKNIGSSDAQGYLLRNLRAKILVGAYDTTAESLNNRDYVTGNSGFFKWPAGEAPVYADIDLDNDPRVFGNRSIVVVGEHPSLVTNTVPGMVLKPGQTLYHYVKFGAQSASDIDMYGAAQLTYNARRF